MNPTFAILAVAMIMALLVVFPASAENVYVDRNPSLYEVLPLDAYGYVVFYVRGVSVQDPFVFIDTYPSDKVMDNSYHPDHTNITDQNAEMLMVEILSDGVSKPEILAAGEYIAYMRHGNGDQPEQYRFKVGGGATERVVFLGAAKPSITKETCEVFTILDKAGYVIHHDEVNHTVHHEAQTHIEIVVDKEAWDENIEHPAETHVVHHEAVTHQETIIDTPAWDETIIDKAAWDETVIDVPAHTEYRSVSQECYTVHDWKWFNNVGWKVKCTNHAEHGDGWHVQTADCTKCVSVYGAWQDTNPCGYRGYGMEMTTYCNYETRQVPAVTHVVHHPAETHTVHHEAVTHEVTVIDVPAWDETVVDKEPWVETIHHDAITHEITVTDKEAWDEIVVDVPAWDEQVGAITHKETVCSKYGNPVPPKGAIKTLF
jgi:hypothetical protein